MFILYIIYIYIYKHIYIYIYIYYNLYIYVKDELGRWIASSFHSLFY